MDRSSSAEDLKTIRKMMEESSRFLSLSGLSGIFAGIFAIAGAIIAWFLILDRGATGLDEHIKSLPGEKAAMVRFSLVLDAMVVLILSVAFALYYSARKARREGRILWSPASRQLLLNLSVPLATGGLFIIILLVNNYVSLVVPGMLIFYGLALVNAGKFTLSEIFWLGLLQIITGLIAALLPDFGLLFWVTGFGLLHIVYGFYMNRKYGA